MTINKKDIHILHHEEKTITLVGAAHVSKESAELVETLIHEVKPDTVCVELCESRYKTIRQKDKWLDKDIIKIIKEKKAFLLLSNLLLASFQKRVAEKFDIKPGQEMINAIESAEAVGAAICPADRDIRVTLSRAWRAMGFREKTRLLPQLLFSFMGTDEITEDDIEKMKESDMLETLLSDIGASHPALKTILIDERDQYLAEKIRTAPGSHIVAVVGAGHVPGIKKHWEFPVDIKALETLPPKSMAAEFIKWGFPLSIILIFIAGFFHGGYKTGTDMIVWWAATTAILAGIGAAAACAHPLSVLSAMLAAPLATLHPLIAAGWVSGLVEAFTRRPKVMDFENLPEDMLSIKGFWRNNVTRILLVVVFTNLGSMIGTFVAIPLMIRLL